MIITPFQLAQRFVGLKEVHGTVDNPQILAMLRLDDTWPEHDEVPWCSAFVNYIAWLLRLPRSKSLAARSWLNVGIPIQLTEAQADSDIVILSRDGGGHVGFYAEEQGEFVLMLGGNQSDSVCIQAYSKQRILGVRRLV